MDSDSSGVDRSKLTFSQAEGIEPLPEPLRLGELSQQARALLWREFYEQITKHSQRPIGYAGPPRLNNPWAGIFYRHWVEAQNKPADEFSDYVDDVSRLVKDLVLSAQWNTVLDFVQFVLRDTAAPYGFAGKIATALEKSRVAYRIVPDPYTFVPNSTEQEGEAIRRAFDDLAQAGLAGARSHLRQGTEALNRGHYADSVRESIHAVESVARKLDPEASSTLAPALRKLGEHIQIHTALRIGFEKIYGYTSDEGGIRHALLEDSGRVDQEDAVFMLGACASFASYLTGKARTAGIIRA